MPLLPLPSPATPKKYISCVTNGTERTGNPTHRTNVFDVVAGKRYEHTTTRRSIHNRQIPRCHIARKLPPHKPPKRAHKKKPNSNNKNTCHKKRTKNIKKKMQWISWPVYIKRLFSTYFPPPSTPAAWPNHGGKWHTMSKTRVDQNENRGVVSAREYLQSPNIGILYIKM